MDNTVRQIQQLLEQVNSKISAMKIVAAAQDNPVADNPPVTTTELRRAAIILFSLAWLIDSNALLITSKHDDLSSEETHHPSRDPLSEKDEVPNIQ